MLNIFQHPSLAEVERLLTAAGLPTDDLQAIDLAHFLAAGTAERPLGVVGLELLGDSALLRSLAVEAEARGSGCGRALVEAAELHAENLGVRTLYLLTTTAAGFFERLGYERVGRESAPPAVRRTREFAGLCPDTAVCMVKRLVAG
jgi:amino-acid N-acetyltransferase